MSGRPSRVGGTRRGLCRSGRGRAASSVLIGRRDRRGRPARRARWPSPDRFRYSLLSREQFAQVPFKCAAYGGCMTGMNETVRYEVDGALATITLNRPEHLNTMSGDLLVGTISALEDAAADPAVRAVILTGAGRGFCAGGDLQGMAAGGRGGGGGGRGASGDGGTPRPGRIERDIANLRANM